jgi:hypothetical protein
MSTLVALLGLYLLHRLLLRYSPAYQARVQRIDRKITWINIILVSYLAVTFLIMVWRYLSQEE